MRIAILGNAGSGKSTLARQLSDQCQLPLVEVDKLLWRPGWQAVPEAEYEVAHAAAIANPSWIMEGVGYAPSIQSRIDRATHVILCDFPIWQNFWLLAERQSQFATGDFSGAPAGVAERPETRVLFELTWRIHETMMPMMRDMANAARRHAKVSILEDVEALNTFTFTP